MICLSVKGLRLLSFGLKMSVVLPAIDFITNRFDKYFLFQNKQLQFYFSVQFCCNVVSNSESYSNCTFKRFY